MFLIGCRGNDPDACRLLRSERWGYGIRSDHIAYGWPEFVDINFREYCWKDHLACVRAYRPRMVMVADYESPKQRKTMLAQVEDVRSLRPQPKPMVCPKFRGAVNDIPNDCIIAVSVPTQYAGFLPDPAELAGRYVHLLGGHPDQYVVLRRLYSKVGALVASADCSAIFQKAQFGSYWSARLNTWREVRGRFGTHALTRASARNVYRYLYRPPELLKDRQRLRAIGFELQPVLPGLR